MASRKQTNLDAKTHFTYKFTLGNDIVLTYICVYLRILVFLFILEARESFAKRFAH